MVRLHTGVELAIALRLIQDRADADPADLAEIEITFGGLGLHWPRIDTDVDVPGLRVGLYGPRRWMTELIEAETDRLSEGAD